MSRWEEPKSKPYVKANLTRELDTAISNITSKLNVTKSHITTTALEYYIRNNYPDSLPKTELEILEKAREDYLYNKSKIWYSGALSSVDILTNYEKDLKIMDGQLQSIIKEQKDTIVTMKKTQNKEIKKGLQLKIDELLNAIESKQDQITILKKIVHDVKQRHIK